MASGDVMLDVVTTVKASSSEDAGVLGVSLAGWRATLSGSNQFPNGGGGTSVAPREVEVSVSKNPFDGQPDHDVPLDQSKQYRVVVTEV